MNFLDQSGFTLLLLDEPDVDIFFAGNAQYDKMATEWPACMQCRLKTRIDDTLTYV